MTRHQVAECTAFACGPTASTCVPSKNQCLKPSLDVVANSAVYNECYPLVIASAIGGADVTSTKEGIHAPQIREGFRQCSRAGHQHRLSRSGSGGTSGCDPRAGGPSAARCDLRTDASERRGCDVESGQREGRRCGV